MSHGSDPDQIKQLTKQLIILYDSNCRLRMETMIWIVLAGLSITFPHIATGVYS